MNDLYITVTNETDESQNIVILQQKDDLNRMFDKLFPVAWRVFPLKKSQHGEPTKGYVAYPGSQTIGVTKNTVSSDLPFGALDIVADATHGDQFKYYLDENQAQNFELRPIKNEDDRISCRNDTTNLVAIAIGRNTSVLACQLNVAEGNWAEFKLTPKLCFMYIDNIGEGHIFKSMQTGDHVIETDLTNCSKIKARLTYDPNADGKKKIWVIEKS